MISSSASRSGFYFCEWNRIGNTGHSRFQYEIWEPKPKVHNKPDDIVIARCLVLLIEKLFKSLSFVFSEKFHVILIVSISTFLDIVLQ